MGIGRLSQRTMQDECKLKKKKIRNAHLLALLALIATSLVHINGQLTTSTVIKLYQY